MAFIRCFLFCVAAVTLEPRLSRGAEPGADSEPASISYYDQVRPIFQARCQGCHQPAKASGQYVMTTRDALLSGGESETTAIIPFQPDESYLVQQITPIDGAAEMPKDGRPLPDSEIRLIREWILRGAIDDTPEDIGPRYSSNNPPEYQRVPVITSIDHSPDGQLIAVAGFHEVLLHHADGSGISGRLIGMSERIESVRFSPDGTRLAVAAGTPARMGELQIWDVATQQLALSRSITFDSIFGVSWSPDQALIAFGCTDKSVRAVDSETGEEVLSHSAHTDWVLDTSFTPDGRYIVSVGRDMVVKLTEVSSGRFVDNITTTPPSILGGGIQTVCSHPVRDEVLFAGADGVPRIYRVHPHVKRQDGDDANLLWELPKLPGRIFSADMNTEGTRIAIASSLDGVGAIALYEMDAAPAISDQINRILIKPINNRSVSEARQLEEHFADNVNTIATIPVLSGGIYAVSFSPDGQQVAAAGTDGVVRLIAATSGEILREFSSIDPPREKSSSFDFVQDVSPVISHLGCNAGKCHGSKDGKKGFKLSLRGYDTIFDVRAFTDDLASRRINVAAPERSLMLLKPTAGVPHEGGQVLKRGSKYYELLRDWIAGGAGVDLDSPSVDRIAIHPVDPVLADIGSQQEIRVIATYTDGSERDVTELAFVESGDIDIVVPVPGKSGLVTAVRRGEAPILARYEGAYAAITVTVMGDRDGFEWTAPPINNPIDEFVDAKLRRMKVLPSPLANDYSFLRRVHVDLTGLPPTVDQIREFVDDSRDPQVKRDELIDELVGNQDFVEHWTNKWADLLQVNRKFLGPQGAAAFRDWIRNEVEQQTPYDEFVRKVLTASGSNRRNPPASYFKILRDPQETMENTTHLFLATRFSCNKCHDHPFERWTQDQYYELSAYFARVGFDEDATETDGELDRNALAEKIPLYEIVSDRPDGEVLHARTGQVAAPNVPFAVKYDSPGENASRREELAAWITSADNDYFAKSYVNRLWGYLTGVGIIEPIDDIRAGNPPSNPELLNWLTDQFIESDFDARHIIKLICKSRTYQLSSETNRWNSDDKINYAHATVRRLPAETLFDAIHLTLGAESRFPGLPPGTRAATLPDAGAVLPDGFLRNLGRPTRESSCECERTNELQLGSVMALVSGPTVADALTDPTNALASLVENMSDDSDLVRELFLRILNRPATDDEVSSALRVMNGMDAEHRALSEALTRAEERSQLIASASQAQRQRRITEAEARLAEYNATAQPLIGKQRAGRQSRIERAKSAIAMLEAELESRLRKWESSPSRAIPWTPLEPVEVSATSGASLTKLADLSVIASGIQGRGDFNVTAVSPLRRITGIRIEALTDESLPNNGPGRGEDGSFVLTEFSVRFANPDSHTSGATGESQFNHVELAEPKATFNEEGYHVSETIDGLSPTISNGWGVSPKLGTAHTAIFHVKNDENLTLGSVLRLTLVNNFKQGLQAIGRFRLSVTDSREPLDFGLPDSIHDILGIDQNARSKGQQTELLSFYREWDPELRELRAALAEAQMPLEKDPVLVQLEKQLDDARQPVMADPQLARLRQQVKTSETQLRNKRMTVAQDIAWALINNPAFLFNH